MPGWSPLHFYFDLLASTLTKDWSAVLVLVRMNFDVLVLIEELDAAGSGDGTLRAWSTLSGAEVRISFRIVLSGSAVSTISGV